MENLNDIESIEIIDRDNLAVVYSIERLESIPLKDRIELVHLKDCGYTCVCEKGYKIGDLVVFIKYDTIVPKNELFSFMLESKYRVKQKSFTERDEEDNIIKKIYSQGIVLPINKVYEFLDTTEEYFGWAIEGLDVTERLEIKKYIPPITGSGSGFSFGVMSKKGDFPTHLMSKTDELNLCNKIKSLKEIQGLPVYITLKVEGSSISCTWDESRDELMVCSRNNQIGEHETNKFWLAANKHNLKKKLQKYPYIAIQAELYGPGVQKNKLGIESVDLAIFNVIDKRTRSRFAYDEMLAFLRVIDVPMVPLVCEINSFDWSFDKLQEYADIQKYTNGETAEGIVIRPYEPFYSKVLKEIWSVKVVNREYKL